MLNLHWLLGKKHTDNTIIDGFKTVEKTVSGYDESDFGPTFSNMQEKDENLKRLKVKPSQKKKLSVLLKNI